MALSVKNMLGGSSSPFFPSVFATGVSQSDDVRLFKTEKTNPNGIPNTYQEVEYLVLNGTQYIDTGYANADGWSIKADVSIIPNGVAQSALCGANGSSSECLVFWTEATKLVDMYNGGTRANATTTASLSTSMHTFEAKLTKTLTYFSIDNEVIINNSGSYTSRLTGTVPFMACARGIGSPELLCSGKWGITHFYDNNGNEIHTYIPCYRKSDNTVGMYDKVTNTFVTSYNGNAFGKGDDYVVLVKEITSKKWVTNATGETGYSFKLNELGTYRLSADNGSLEKTYDVLVDYPLEYVIAVKYSVDIPMTEMTLSTPSPTTNTSGLARRFTINTLIKGYKTDGGYSASGVNSYTVNSDDSIYVKSSTSAGGYGIGVVKKLDVGQYKFSFNASWSGAYSSFSILGYAESGTFHAYVTDKSALANGYNEFTFDVLESYPIIVIVYSSAYNGDCTFSNIVLETI